MTLEQVGVSLRTGMRSCDARENAMASRPLNFFTILCVASLTSVSSGSAPYNSAGSCEGRSVDYVWAILAVRACSIHRQGVSGNRLDCSRCPR